MFRVFRLPLSVRRAPTPTYSAPLAHCPLTHTPPHHTDDAFGLEFGDLLVDTDHSHSLMEVTAMVSADVRARGVGRGGDKCLYEAQGQAQAACVTWSASVL